MPHYDDITKPVQQEEGSSKSHENDAELRYQRHSLPGASITIREEPSVCSAECGAINPGDVITVSGVEFDANDMKWFKVVVPVQGYCISRHPMAKPFRDDESIFVATNTPPPPVSPATEVKVSPTTAPSPSMEVEYVHSIPTVAIAIRAATSTSSESIGTINPGDHIHVVGDEIKVEVYGETGYWYKITFPAQGYCISRHSMLPGDGRIFRPVASSSSISSDTTTAPPSNLKSKSDNFNTSASCAKAKGSESGGVSFNTDKKTKLRHVLPNVSIALRAETSTKSKKLGAINTGDIITIVGDEITVNSSTTGELNSTWYRVVRPLKGFCISSHPLANALRPDGKIFVSIDDEEEHMDDSSPTTNFGGDAIDSVMRLIVPNVVVNIRHQPSISSKVVGAIKSGEIIKADRFIRGFNNMDWYRLVTPVKGGYCTANHPFTGAGMFLPCAMGESNANGGSVTASHTSSSNPSDYGFPPFPIGGSSGVRKVLFIEGVEIRIRASPSFSAEIIGGVAYNDEVVVTAERVVSVGGTDTEWYQITHPARGYVMSRHRCAYQKGYDTDNLFNDVNLPRPCPGSPTVQGIAITQDQPFVVGDVFNEPILPPFAQRSAEYQ